MKNFFGKRSRNTLALILTVSAVAHIIALALMGTVLIVQEALREEKTFEAVKIEQIEQVEPEYTVNIEQRNQNSAPPRLNPIVVNDVSDLNIPRLDIDIDIDSSNPYGRGRGGGGFGVGGRTPDIRETLVSAQIFGKLVESNKLGVVLDVSFSTHDVIDTVINEIQKNFKDAIIIFTPGCAIIDRKSEIFSLKDVHKGLSKYELPDDSIRSFEMSSFLQPLLERNEFKSIWDKARSRNLGYVVFSELIEGKKRTDTTVQQVAMMP